MMVVAILMF